MENSSCVYRLCHNHIEKLFRPISINPNANWYRVDGQRGPYEKQVFSVHGAEILAEDGETLTPVKFRYTCKPRLEIDEARSAGIHILVGVTRDKYSTNKSSHLLLLHPILSLLVSAHRAEPLSRVLIVIYITSRAYENARLLLREREREREWRRRRREWKEGEEKGLNGTILPSSNFLTSRVRVPYRRDNGRFRWGECNRFILFRENLFFFFFFLFFFFSRCSFYAIGFSPFSSTLDCSATTNQDHLTESTPHFVSNISLSLSFSLKRTHTHNRVPFTPASPPIFLSLSLSRSVHSLSRSPFIRIRSISASWSATFTDQFVR